MCVNKSDDNYVDFYLRYNWGYKNLKRDRRFLSHPDITPFGRVPDQLPNPVNLSLHGKHSEDHSLLLEQENQAGISLVEPSSDLQIQRGTRWIMQESGCFSEPIYETVDNNIPGAFALVGKKWGNNKPPIPEFQKYNQVYPGQGTEWGVSFYFNVTPSIDGIFWSLVICGG